MSNYTDRSSLQVSPLLVEFLESEVLPGLEISADNFWTSFASIIDELGPKNRQLLKQRDVIQDKLDAWNVANKGKSDSPDYMQRYKNFLTEIGYLVEEKPAFEISTTNVDDEVAKQAGPQLVVPTSNARFAINAANARWGSLYDALYGTDAISEDDGAHRSGAYNPVRGDKVITYARNLLDAHFALANGSHKDAQAYQIIDGQLSVTLPNGEVSALKNPSQCVGFQGDALKPSSILLLNNGLHVGIEIDPASAIGKTDKAGVSDLMMEAALSTIQDFEDSVAAVDAADKVGVYRNWLGLMKGDLSEKFEKNGQIMERTLAQDKHYTALDGSELILHGRSLLFCRNVGHLMSNPAILDQRGDEIQEGIMDAMITVLIALYDIKGLGQLRNSRTGSVYIVKPKMHGPKEVAFANELFNRVEDALGLTRHTIKIGVMDEERRTTVNLKECIREVKERIVFINTGFLDRTGDEIHTSMLLGAMAPKADIKNKQWINAYEDWNVDIGLACGFSGKAQIGKGMWAMPDAMAEMLVAKIGHPKSGANTAWVPSPNGATLHAMHYHQVNVFDLHKDIAKRERASVEDILTVPLCENPAQLTEKQIQAEIDNNAQGILGYVVRWIDSGIGCSKVPDINNVGLMEDRATLRISSQHIGNWIAHNICTLEQVTASFERMAAVVDKQNANVADYTPMAVNLDASLAYQAALALAVNAKEQPNGYTEPLLHDYRLRLKAQ